MSTAIYYLVININFCSMSVRRTPYLDTPNFIVWTEYGSTKPSLRPNLVLEPWSFEFDANCTNDPLSPKCLPKVDLIGVAREYILLVFTFFFLLYFALWHPIKQWESPAGNNAQRLGSLGRPGRGIILTVCRGTVGAISTFNWGGGWIFCLLL